MTVAADRTSGRPDIRGAVSPWLRLARVPNLPTVPGDVLVGYFLAAGVAGNIALTELPYLVGASLLLYCSGLVLNDFFDAETDRKERSDRPIPSGAISKWTALATFMVMLAAALSLSALAGVYSLATASILTGLIIFYNSAARRIPAIGFTVMGLCRSLNVLLGASVILPAITPEPVIAAVVTGLFIVTVTLLAFRETGEKPKAYLCVLPLAIVLAGFGVFISMSTFSWAGIGGALIAILGILAVTVRLMTGKDKAVVPGCIGAFIRSLILVQAGLMLVGMGEMTIAAGIIYALWPLSRLLGRWFYGS